jgi:glutamate dehydrogenase
MRAPHADAIRDHRLRRAIVATKAANRLVNRLGPSVAFELTEEEGCSLGQVFAAFLAAEQLLGLQRVWTALDDANIAEPARIELFQITAGTIRGHLSDLIRAGAGLCSAASLITLVSEGLSVVDAEASRLIRAEVREEAAARRERLVALGASEDIVSALVRLYELDGVFGLAALATRTHGDSLMLARAYTRIGEALGLDWAQRQVARFIPADQWERLLIAGLARDLEQVRIDFLARLADGDPDASLDRWIGEHSDGIEQFRRSLVASRAAPRVTAAMLAHLTNQARILLSK